LLRDLLPARFGPLDLLEPGAAPLLLEPQDNRLGWAPPAARKLEARAGDGAFERAAAAALDAARRVRRGSGSGGKLRRGAGNAAAAPGHSPVHIPLPALHPLHATPPTPRSHLIPSARPAKVLLALHALPFTRSLHPPPTPSHPPPPPQPPPPPPPNSLTRPTRAAPAASRSSRAAAACSAAATSRTRLTTRGSRRCRPPSRAPSSAGSAATTRCGKGGPAAPGRRGSAALSVSPPRRQPPLGS
jgi:hypothetical protein